MSKFNIGDRVAVKYTVQPHVVGIITDIKKLGIKTLHRITFPNGTHDWIGTQSLLEKID